MKTFAFLLLWMATITVSLAQDKELIGNWDITECAYCTESGTLKTMEKEIAAGTAITTFIFEQDGTFIQTSNMTSSREMETFAGTWEINGPLLTVKVQTNKGRMKFDYSYELKGDTLILTVSSGTAKFVNTFKKQN